jgi:hypothetical protein
MSDPRDSCRLLGLCGLHERQQGSHHEEQNFFSHSFFSVVQHIATSRFRTLLFHQHRLKQKCPTAGETGCAKRTRNTPVAGPSPAGLVFHGYYNVSISPWVKRRAINGFSLGVESGGL